MQISKWIVFPLKDEAKTLSFKSKELEQLKHTIAVVPPKTRGGGIQSATSNQVAAEEVKPGSAVSSLLLNKVTRVCVCAVCAPTRRRRKQSSRHSVMTRKKQLRALVSDKLAAAAEEILSGAERLLGE